MEFMKQVLPRLDKPTEPAPGGAEGGCGRRGGGEIGPTAPASSDDESNDGRLYGEGVCIACRPAGRLTPGGMPPLALLLLLTALAKAALLLLGALPKAPPPGACAAASLPTASPTARPP